MERISVSPTEQVRFGVVREMFGKYLGVQPRRFDMGSCEQMCYTSAVGYLFSENAISIDTALTSFRIALVTGYSPALFKLNTGQLSPVRCGVLRQELIPSAKSSRRRERWYWLENHGLAVKYLHLLSSPFYGPLPKELEILGEYWQSLNSLVQRFDEIRLGEVPGNEL